MKIYSLQRDSLLPGFVAAMMTHRERASSFLAESRLMARDLRSTCSRPVLITGSSYDSGGAHALNDGLRNYGF